jgi:hypothetical protein
LGDGLLVCGVDLVAVPHVGDDAQGADRFRGFGAAVGLTLAMPAAMPRPMPAPPPVTTATRPVSKMSDGLTVIARRPFWHCRARGR